MDAWHSLPFVSAEAQTLFPLLEKSLESKGEKDKETGPWQVRHCLCRLQGRWPLSSGRLGTLVVKQESEERLQGCRDAAYAAILCPLP